MWMETDLNFVSTLIFRKNRAYNALRLTVKSSIFGYFNGRVPIFVCELLHLHKER